MARLKLNLPTGLVVEKPIISCFEVENNKYLILDAENIGSMGLPIILVCKIEQEKVVKITDASEWQQAKNYLKGIIAGNTMNYISVGSEIAADEIYYTQLTLPIASFDVIKNSYQVDEPVVEKNDVPIIEEPVIPSVNPIVPEIESNNVPEIAPVIDIPVIPTDNDVVSDPIPVVPITPEIPEIPTLPEIPVVSEEVEEETQENDIDFSETKKAFMSACENMFDALVEKFKLDLNSKK